MYTKLLPNSFSLEKQTLKSLIHIDNNLSHNILTFNNQYVNVIENPYDCGCLIIGYTNDITKKFQDLLEQFMNENGYSKIIGTIAIDLEYSNVKERKTKYTQLGYTLIPTGKSPRHPNEDVETYLIYKIINPTFKGYT